MGGDTAGRHAAQLCRPDPVDVARLALAPPLAHRQTTAGTPHRAILHVRIRIDSQSFQFGHDAQQPKQIGRLCPTAAAAAAAAATAATAAAAAVVYETQAAAHCVYSTAGSFGGTPSGEMRH